MISEVSITVGFISLGLRIIAPTVKHALRYFENWNQLTSRRISWKEFRKSILGLSVASTAKMLVIQISLIQDMEKTGRNQQMIKDLLAEWGIPIEAINYDPPSVIKRNNLAELA